MAADSYCFEGQRLTVSVNKSVWRVWQEHRQTKEHQPESFGVLIGSTSGDRRAIYVEESTTPMPGDRKSRNNFDLRDPGHQRAVDAAHSRSDGSLIYLGTWHTHPQPIPRPSPIDKADWHRCMRRNRARALVFVIVGTQRTCVYVRWGIWFRALTQLTGNPG